ncbi:MAG TPA: hypothetical protein VGS41_01015 [Chthonomonadales bacterium]|nr:hypothetical protein [Chthonomonadales bacterium]
MSIATRSDLGRGGSGSIAANGSFVAATAIPNAELVGSFAGQAPFSVALQLSHDGSAALGGQTWTTYRTYSSVAISAAQGATGSYTSVADFGLRVPRFCRVVIVNPSGTSAIPDVRYDISDMSV